jgi:Tol biopolymer transport system component
VKRIAIFVLVGLSPALEFAPGHAQSGYDLYQTALVMERSSGEMREAIRLYEQIATRFASDPALAAQALLRIAHVQETLGDPDAGATYQRLLSDYSDQTDMAARARSRLTALRPAEAPEEASASQVARLLMRDNGGCYVWGMNPSPDGTRLAYSDICETGAVFVRDLASGESRRVSTGEDWYFGAVWSPDGTRLAVKGSRPRGSLEIIDLESGSVEIPAALEGLPFSPWDWSADGENLAGNLQNDDRTSSSVVVSLRTGEVTVLAPRVNQGSNSTAFSPDGRHVVFTDLVDGNQDVYAMALGSGDRHRISTSAGPDGKALWSPDGRTIVWDNDGGAWAIDVVDGRPSGTPRLIRNEPLAGNAWTEHGFYHTVDNTVEQAYRLPVDPATGRPTGTPEPFPEPKGFNWLAWSPDMTRVASSSWQDRQHIHVTNGPSVTAYPIGDEILTSNLWWTPDGEEILFTSASRASRDKRKTVFALDPADGRLRELFPRRDDIHHLHVSPDGSRMVFLRRIGNRLAAELVVSDVGDPDGLVLATGPGDEGRLSTHFGQPRFSPDGTQILFLRNRGTQDDNVASLWVVPSDGSAPPREVMSTEGWITWMFGDPSGRFVAFQRLEAEAGAQRTADLQLVVTVVDVETGVTHDILGPVDETTNTNLRAWSPDGRWIAYSQTTGRWEFWVTEDVLGEDYGS